MITDLTTYTPQKDMFYFILPWGLGDTMILCGLKNVLEKKFGGKICLIGKPSQEAIFKMYEIEHYLTANFTVRRAGNCSHIDLDIPLANQPEKGCYFIAHPDFHPRYARLVFWMGLHKFNVRFISWYNEFFGLPQNTRALFPTHYPAVSEEVVRKFTEFYPGRSIREAVLILPEAVTVIGPARPFWDFLIKKLKEKDIPLVTNILDPEKTPLFPGVLNYDFSLEQLIAFSYACGDIYALRSGICDILCKKGRQLHVYYPSKEVMECFSLCSMFPGVTAHEQLYSEADLPDGPSLPFCSGDILCATNLRVMLKRYRYSWSGRKIILEQKELVNKTGDWKRLEEIEVKRPCRFQFRDPPVSVQFLRGFSIIEDWGIWTDKTTSEMTWLIPEDMVGKGLVISLKADIALLNTSSQRFEVYVNGIRVLKTVLTQQYGNVIKIVVPAGLVISSLLRIKFKMLDALVSPHDVDPNNPDIRQIGIGMVEASLALDQVKKDQ